MTFFDRVPLDLGLAGIALCLALAFAVTSKPWYQTAILVLVACVWGSEAAVLASHLAQKQAIYLRWHPVFAVTTSVAVIALYALRRFGRR